jgi:hypothetical protein
MPVDTPLEIIYSFRRGGGLMAGERYRRLDGKPVAVSSTDNPSWWALKNGDVWIVAFARKVVNGDVTLGPYTEEKEAITKAKAWRPSE